MSDGSHVTRHVRQNRYLGIDSRPEIPPSYLIFREGSYTKAKNGTTGVIDFEGTDASTVIQAAINALTSGVIHLAVGIFVLSTYITLKSNIVFEGEGSGTILSGADVFRTEASASNWGIRNLAMEGNGTGIAIYLHCPAGPQTHYNPFVINCKINNFSRGLCTNTDVVVRRLFFQRNIMTTFTNVTYGVVYLYNLHDSVISDNYIEGAQAAGIAISSGINIKIKDNTLKNCLQTLIYNGVITFSNRFTCYDALIEGNTIELPNVATGNRHGIVISGETYAVNSTSEVRVKGNRIYGVSDNPGHGIYIHGSGAAAKNVYRVLVSQNHINRVACGVVFVNALDSRIVRNTLTLCSGTAPIIGLSVADNIRARDNIGFVTENVVLSPAFAIDAVALVTVTIPHGLAITPAIEDCSLTIVEDTNVDDWGYNLLKVDSVGAANVVAKVNVSVASATGGATAKLSLRVGKA